MIEQKFVDVEALEITISQSIDKYWNGKNGYYLAEDALKEINHFPTADVVPVVHGRWIDAYPNIEPNPMFMYGICSECGFEQGISKYLKYCPNCGAKMDGGV